MSKAARGFDADSDLTGEHKNEMENALLVEYIMSVSDNAQQVQTAHDRHMLLELTLSRWHSRRRGHVGGEAHLPTYTFTCSQVRTVISAAAASATRLLAMAKETVHDSPIRIAVARLTAAGPVQIKSMLLLGVDAPLERSAMSSEAKESELSGHSTFW